MSEQAEIVIIGALILSMFLVISIIELVKERKKRRLIKALKKIDMNKETINLIGYMGIGKADANKQSASNEKTDG